jgi:hypothetical protein
MTIEKNKSLADSHEAFSKRLVVQHVDPEVHATSQIVGQIVSKIEEI